MIKNILITGCNGQLGNEMQLQSKLPENDSYTYFFTDVEELDITDEKAVNAFVETHEIDCIVNCAAYTNVDKSESNEELCHLLNSVAPGYLAKAIDRRKGTIIQVSTDYVFDGTSYTPYQEDEPTCPRSVYGSTKLEGEQQVMAECTQAVIIRTAWLYSRFGGNFVKTMLRLGRERDSLNVVFDQIGTPTYARDLAAAISAVIRHGIVPGIYHFSNEGVTSWYDFTCAIHRIAGINNCNVQPIHTAEYPTPATRPHYSVLDKTKIKNTYGITINHWETSLNQCISEILAGN
ncbi:MAG: dTDP-4-dehydrorhamnose reductase [Bacteroidaceae bacterium]|nr:dTDP-4-dehydrorhamnose reductase [Bacteroidaceae bacterium]